MAAQASSEEEEIDDTYSFSECGSDFEYEGKAGYTTDPKKHFETVNFILGHFVNFLEEIYQEKTLDVSSPLTSTYNIII